MPGKTTSWLVLGLALALVAAPLAAGDSRWYLAGKIGEASVEEEFGPPGFFGWTVDGDDSLAAIEVGYTLHDYVSVQGGYRDLGSVVGRPRPCPPTEICPLALTFPVVVDFTGFTLTAVPTWPATERISVFGKVGLLDWDADVAHLFGGRPIESRSHTELLTGLGARYEFPNGFGVLLELETSSLMTATSVGATWRF